MPEHDPEQELGPKIASAFQSQADAAGSCAAGGWRPKLAGVSASGGRR